MPDARCMFYASLQSLKHFKAFFGAGGALVYDCVTGSSTGLLLVANDLPISPPPQIFNSLSRNHFQLLDSVILNFAEGSLEWSSVSERRLPSVKSRHG